MRYTAPAPRNAICEVRVADDEAYLYFYIRAAENIELYPDEHNCMSIFIASLGGGTCVGGIDYVVGREIYQAQFQAFINHCSIIKVERPGIRESELRNITYRQDVYNFVYHEQL